jgi:hypothetical protein
MGEGEARLALWFGELVNFFHDYDVDVSLGNWKSW